jgi:phosphotriesterase-related protein
LFGVATGGALATGLATHFSGPVSSASLSAIAQAPPAPAIGRAIVRTVLGDLDPSAVSGATLMHEHLGTGVPEPARGGGAPAPPDPTRDAAWMAQELQAARKAGLGCIVAAQTIVPGDGNIPYLTTLAKTTGLHIVAAGAYYSAQTYPRDVASKSEEQIAADLVQAARNGRFGAFGEFGMLNNTADLDPLERKVFHAVARAQAQTGIPIFTHTNYSTGANVAMDIGLRQLDALESGGGRLASIAIGHVCCLDDPMVSVARRIAQRGAYVAFDRVTRQQQWVPDEKKARMVAALIDAGLVDRLLISSDYIGRVNTAVGEVNMYPGPLHARDGGPGYARPLILFLPHLRKAGVSEDAIRRLTVDNPRRFLSFVPAQA